MRELESDKKFSLVSESKPLARKEDTSYESTPLKDWTSKHSLAWVMHFARKSQIDFVDLEICRFKCSGEELMLMTRQQFIEKDCRYGSDLFDELDTFKCKRSHARRGLATKSKKGRLVWKFLRDLLHDPQYCPEWIRWENPEQGTFRFMKKEDIARKWGSSSNSKNEMTYEKFSRAIRQNYASEMLAADPTRLVYRFGPKAYGWKHADPNFNSHCPNSSSLE